MKQATNLHDLSLPLLLPGASRSTPGRLLPAQADAVGALQRQELGAVRELLSEDKWPLAQQR
jgi:hypothetical protein